LDSEIVLVPYGFPAEATLAGTGVSGERQGRGQGGDTTVWVRENALLIWEYRIAKNKIPIQQEGVAR